MKRLIIFLLSLIISFNAYSQINVNDQSAYLDSILTDINSDVDYDVALNIIDKQLSLKGSIIESLKSQIIQIDKDIYNNEMYFERLNSQLEYEKNIYSDLVVRAWRLRSLMRQNFDVFSFDNLYKIYRQFLYVKWMGDYRLKKIKRINSLKAEIAKVVISLNNAKESKNTFAQKLGVEQNWISKYSRNRNDILKKYSNFVSGNPSANISDDNSTVVVHSDSSLVAHTNIVDTSSTSTMLFQVQRGYLIWPVRKSVIISNFGESQHPVYDKVTVRNDGLDFLVPSDAEVRCVYKGIVSKVVNLPGKTYAVVVSHGNYFTVYSGLDHIKVTNGDNLETSDVLGSFDGEKKYSVLNFQIWSGITKLNPTDWLIKYPSGKK